MKIDAEAFASSRSRAARRPTEATGVKFCSAGSDFCPAGADLPLAGSGTRAIDAHISAIDDDVRTMGGNP